MKVSGGRAVKQVALPRLFYGPENGNRLFDARRKFLDLVPPDWLSFKNPAAPAVKREAEEDWSR